MNLSKKYYIGTTILGVPIAFLVWMLVSITAHVLLYMLDSVRGLADDFLQSLFREWFTPCVGGYVAIYVVNRYLPSAKLLWVAIGFCSPLLLFFIGFSLYTIVFHGDQFDFSWEDQITNWGMAIATSIGAYIGYSKYDKKLIPLKKNIIKNHSNNKYIDCVDELLNEFSLSIKILDKQNFDAHSFIEYSIKQNYSRYETAAGIARSYADIQIFTDYKLSQTLAVKWAKKVQNWIKEGLVSMERLKSVLASFEELSFDQANKQTETSSVKIYNTQPNMPDITALKNSPSFEADEYNIIFGKDTPTIASNGRNQIETVKYLYIMVVLHKKNGMPQYFVTLEKGITDGHFLCIFDKDGAHNNYGKYPELDNKNNFVERALEIIKEEFMFEHIKENKSTE